MNFTPSGLLAAIVFGTIGIFLVREGKRRLNFTVMCTGLVMLMYNLFTSSPWMDWVGGFALCGVAAYFWFRNN